jgi:hypothetical protein
MLELIPKAPSGECELKRELISAYRISMRGWDDPDPPTETRPLQELIKILASLIVEAGSPLR